MSVSPASTVAGDEKTLVTVQQAEMGVFLEKRRLICNILNFDKLRQSDKLVEAQKFQFEAGDSTGLPTTWHFYLQVKEIGDSKKKTIGTFLSLVKKPKGTTDVFASYHIAVKNSNGGNYRSGKADCKNMAEVDGGWGFWLVEQDANLTDVVQRDGSLVIEVEFSLLSQVPPVCVDVPGKVKAFEVKSLEKLSQDLGQLRLFKDANSDSSTAIISQDGVKFPVNRGILSTRSSVFQRMFQQKMKESITGEVHIDDLSGKTMEVLLHYLYTGTLHQDWMSPEVIEELTSAAHRYDLDILTAFLDDILGSVATKENAMRLAIAARTLGMEKAEKELFDLVKKSATNLEDLQLTLEPQNGWAKWGLWGWNKRTEILSAITAILVVLIAISILPWDLTLMVIKGLVYYASVYVLFMLGLFAECALRLWLKGLWSRFTGNNEDEEL